MRKTTLSHGWLRYGQHEDDDVSSKARQKSSEVTCRNHRIVLAIRLSVYWAVGSTKKSQKNRQKEKNKGRKRMIRPEDGLGLVLAWTRTRGSLMALQLIFGMTYSNLDDYLLYGKRIIVKVLWNDPRASVKIPSSERIAEYKEMVSNRHPYLTDVWCTMDGLKLTLQQRRGYDDYEYKSRRRQQQQGYDDDNDDEDMTTIIRR